MGEHSTSGTEGALSPEPPPRHAGRPVRRAGAREASCPRGRFHPPKLLSLASPPPQPSPLPSPHPMTPCPSHTPHP